MYSTKIRGAFTVRHIDVTPGDTCHVTIEIHASMGVLERWEFNCDMDFTALCEGLDRMERGDLIQDAFPTLSAETRENFITPPCWR